LFADGTIIEEYQDDFSFPSVLLNGQSSLTGHCTLLSVLMPIRIGSTWSPSTNPILKNGLKITTGGYCYEMCNLPERIHI
jgi:hypothetical protein